MLNIINIHIIVIVENLCETFLCSQREVSVQLFLLFYILFHFLLLLLFNVFNLITFYVNANVLFGAIMNVCAFQFLMEFTLIAFEEFMERIVNKKEYHKCNRLFEQCNVEIHS